MRYLGIAKKEQGLIVLPDLKDTHTVSELYEAFEIDGHIVLLHPPVSRKRQRQIRELTREAITTHKPSFKEIRK
jgi:hypothetical protein